MPTDSRSGDSEIEMDRQIERQENMPIKPGHSTPFTWCLQQLLTSCNVGEATIDILPEDALLTIFLLYGDVCSSDLSWWQPLVHVCRRWRRVIFASPRHLNLTLICTTRTPARESLDIWPPIPIALRFTSYEWRGHNKNIIAAMERPDRITDIRLENLSTHNIEHLSRMMESPLPALISLSLRGCGLPHPLKDLVLRDMFLGGSAPSLRTLILTYLQFPALPKLLLSATQLVTLQLSWVPTLGDMSLQEIVTCLAALPKLKQLGITHPHKFPEPDQSLLPTRVVLPSLTSFYFYGISEHLADFVAQIDAPMLQTLSLTLGSFIHIPQLLRFISRAEKLKSPNRAAFVFEPSRLLLKFMPSDGSEFSTKKDVPFNQFITMISLCLSLSPLLSHVERLDFHCNQISLSTQEFQVVDPSLWLDLFRPFTAVQSLCVPKEVWPQVEPALRALTEEGATEVFPKLRTLFLEEPSEEDKKSIESLISARGLTVQPCTAPYPIPSVNPLSLWDLHLRTLF